MGMVSLKPVTSAAWFHFPQPFSLDYQNLLISPSLTMIIIALVSMVESTGVFFALGNLLNKDILAMDLKRGYRAEGLARYFRRYIQHLPLYHFLSKRWFTRIVWYPY